MAAFLVGLLATFLFVRINTRLIRAQVSWWFHDIESEGGTHVHHMVIGVVLMVTVGILLIATDPTGIVEQTLALLFGVGVALTLDEFALILNLQDVYWRKEGRLSVDAVIIVVAVAALFVLGVNPFGGFEDSDLSGNLLRVAVAAYVVVNIVPVLFCLLKGKIWTGVIGLFVPFMAIVGAIRIARLNSPWARRRYAKKPKKLAKARRREARLDARWIAWRDAFFDLIAGKPHLPSLPPLGPNGLPLTAATAGNGEQLQPAGEVELDGELGSAGEEEAAGEADAHAGAAGEGDAHAEAAGEAGDGPAGGEGEGDAVEAGAKR
jgi:lysyl-tRNA synthetase class 2